jgi:hypothetical protein
MFEQAMADWAWSLVTVSSPIPTKNARMFPLPEWYLPKGTINASDHQLEAASSSCERWGMGFAGLVVISVIAELVIAWVQPSYSSFLTDSAITDAAVAIGIAGEVLLGTIWNNGIQTELRKRSNEKVAVATDRASAAQEALAKFRTPRYRLLEPPENREKLLTALKPFAGTIFVVGHDDLDRDVWDFLWVLEPIIREAGWVQADWQGGRTFGKQDWPGNHLYGVAGVVNVSIEIRPSLDVPDEALRATLRAAAALAAVLKEIGIDAGVAKQPNNSSIQTNLVALLVGPKL